MSEYEQQYERVKRWFNRIQEESHAGKDEKQDVIRLKDYYLTFFQNCYHLKDHIQKDSSAIISESELNSFIDTTDCMSLCADICNATKHLELNSAGRSGESPEVSEGAHVTDRPSKGTSSATYKIHTNNRTVDAFDLAEECISAWEGFMKKRGCFRLS